MCMSDDDVLASSDYDGYNYEFDENAGEKNDGQSCYTHIYTYTRTYVRSRALLKPLRLLAVG